MKNIILTIKEAEFCLEALKTLMQLRLDQLVICELWPDIGKRWNRIDLGDTSLMKDRLVYLLKRAKEVMWIIKDPVIQERVCRCVSPEDLSDRFETSQMLGLDYVYVRDDSAKDPVMYKIHKSLFKQEPIKRDDNNGNQP